MVNLEGIDIDVGKLSRLQIADDSIMRLLHQLHRNAFNTGRQSKDMQLPTQLRLFEQSVNGTLYKPGRRIARNIC